MFRICEHLHIDDEQLIARIVANQIFSAKVQGYFLSAVKSRVPLLSDPRETVRRSLRGCESREGIHDALGIPQFWG